MYFLGKSLEDIRVTNKDIIFSQTSLPLANNHILPYSAYTSCNLYKYLHQAAQNDPKHETMFDP